MKTTVVVIMFLALILSTYARPNYVTFTVGSSAYTFDAYSQSCYLDDYNWDDLYVYCVLTPTNKNVTGDIEVQNWPNRGFKQGDHTYWPFGIHISDFSGCTNMTSIKIVNTCEYYKLLRYVYTTYYVAIQTMADGAFQGCSSMTNAMLVSTIKELPANAFKCCSNLTYVCHWCEGIGDCAFESCVKLPCGGISENTRTIGERAFKGCETLGEIGLGENLTSVGVDAFEGTISLSNVVAQCAPPEGVIASDMLANYPRISCPTKYEDEWQDIRVACSSNLVVKINPSTNEVVQAGEMRTVSMSCDVSNAIIYYTLDGSEPSTDSFVYTKKFKVTPGDGMTIKASAIIDRWPYHSTQSVSFAPGKCETPISSMKDGEKFYFSNQKVVLNVATEGAAIRYTLDGSEPTQESALYSAPIIISETTTIRAKAFYDTYFDSEELRATLVREWLQVSKPEISAQEEFVGSKQKVVLACATEGATIYYTIDGSDPTIQSAIYEKPFYVTDTTTVKAYATKADYTNSDIGTFLITKVWGIGDTMGKPDHTFETGGAKGFVRVEDTTATLGESMKSGAITDNQKSILSTKVVGPGTLTFKWKASCEEDDDYEWDHGEFKVDGKLKGQINGVTDWTEVSRRITGDGEHTVTWTYVKDDNESVEQDCIWVSDYAWASDYTETQTTQVPVPYDWLKAKSRDIVDEYENYEKVAKQTAYNPRFTVEQCYVAGLDPESTTNEFTATIGPDLSIGWKPDLKAERNYKVWGSTNLVNGGDWEWPTNALHRFFKVTVEMP